MKVSDTVDWDMINRIVRPEHQYKHVEEPPIPAIRMAWPFKTEEELKILSRWFREEEKKLKKKQIQDHVNKFGKSLL